VTRSTQLLLALLATAAFFVTACLASSYVDTILSRVIQTVPSTQTAPYEPAGPSSVPSPIAPAVSTFTPTATASATPSPTPSPTPTPAFRPVEPAVELTGVVHAWQTWNNCGPATLSMYLSYCGLDLTQTDIAAVLRPNPDDKNVSPEELANFARAQGLQALVGYDGTAEQLRLLLSNGIPVIIETWHEPEPGDGMGHYRLLVGYNDAARHWIVYDSYDTVNLRGADPYLGLATPYDEVESLWPAFNRVYVVVYDPALEPVVRGIVGPEVGTPAMWEAALAHAEAEVAARPDDVFAWFNLGSSLTHLGRMAEATEAYRQAEAIGWPKRMLWYQFEPYQAFYEQGEHDTVIRFSDQVMALTDQIEEVWYWRGRALAGRGEADAARAAFERALALNPGYRPALMALEEVG